MTSLGRVTLAVGLAMVSMAVRAPEEQATPLGVSEPYLSPAAVRASPDGKHLYLACATAGRVVVVDTESGKVLRTLRVSEAPSGLALSGDGGTLWVTCAGPRSVVEGLDLASGLVKVRIPVGHTALSPALSPDGATLYVCHRFDDEVVFIEVASGEVRRRVRVSREPVSVASTPDGKYLLVAHHLPSGPSNADRVAASVSVISVADGQVCREIALPNGSTLVREIAVSPDGRHAVVAHQLSRFHLPTTQLERGWVNTSAVSLIAVDRLERINTVLLDHIDAGAANPWGVCWSPDGRRFCVTHAGTHEVSLVELAPLLDKLAKVAAPDATLRTDPLAASRSAEDVPNDLSFLVGLRSRIRLGSGDLGPRAVVMTDSHLWVVNYFSDTVTRMDPRGGHAASRSFSIGSGAPMTVVRRGEFLFNDASLCFQGWQSCASCHSQDARVDGLNWDNLNDGIGNPKNSKSLLLAHRTPPAMWLGVRSNAYVGVRMGIKHSLFTVQPPDVAQAMDAFMESLRPIPSPRLVAGKLSEAAERGRGLFFSEAVGCSPCHRGELYTDLKFHDVGTVGTYDHPTNRFDTPTLIELWRTGPYLHDGRAASLREVLTTCNPQDQHGTTTHLTPAQVDDLVEFLLSL